MTPKYYVHDFSGYLDHTRARECTSCGRADCHPAHRGHVAHDLRPNGQCRRCGTKPAKQQAAAA